ncbi:hypothetical protein [Microvirga terricola]|uniref:Triphosphoribosyl-dephospho-CoA synthase n=1 Tax=Microvirga terricola TaxID=2719797 RepID=A0ABX0V861_9HYPH|nr:hypothetical protein [Microvirga terricola]NIX75401.1 hypothetical protein [Microvirga terricola]
MIALNAEPAPARAPCDRRKVAAALLRAAGSVLDGTAGGPGSQQAITATIHARNELAALGFIQDEKELRWALNVLRGECAGDIHAAVVLTTTATTLLKAQFNAEQPQQVR